jgi:lanthanide-dependent methanol dehydrogenase
LCTWNPNQRPGDKFARDPDTGEAKWVYQMTPHDEWDYDGINENILTDKTIDGKTHKVLVHFDRNGFAYTIDRTDGVPLWWRLIAARWRLRDQQRHRTACRQ